MALQDITSMYSVLTVLGPKSRPLMEEMTGQSMAMAPMTYRMVHVGYANGVGVLSATNTSVPG